MMTRMPSRSASARRVSDTLRRVVGLGILVLGGCASAPPTEPTVSLEARRWFATGVEALQRHDTMAAQAAFDAAVAVGPLYVDAHRQRQNLRLGSHDREGAIREYRSLLDEHPQVGAAHYLHGRLLHRLADQNAAFARATELDPGLVWGHYGLAVIADRSGDRRAAQHHVERALSIESDHAPALLLKGRFLLADSRFDEGDVFLRLAAARDPTLDEAWTLMAAVRAAKGRRFDELRVLEAAVTKNPRHAGALHRLVELSERGADHAAAPAALGLLQVAARATGDDPVVLDAVARSLESQGVMVPAADAALRALEAGATDSRTVFCARRMLIHCGRPADAFATWARHCAVPESEMTAELHELREVAKHSQAAEAGTDPGETAKWRAELTHALDRAGWHVEAAFLARRLSPAYPVTAEGGRFDAVFAHERLLSLLRLHAEETLQDAAAGKLGGLEEFIDVVARLIEEVTGQSARHGNDVLTFPFLGDILDVSRIEPGSINAYFRAHGQVFLAGRLAGQPALSMLFSLVTPPRPVALAGWSASFQPIEVIGDNAALRPLDEMNREVGGRALWKFYYLDLDVIGTWRRTLDAMTDVDPTTTARLLGSRGLEARNEAERLAVDLPLDMGQTLLLRARQEWRELPVLDSVRAHEAGHLFDTLSYVPFWDNFFANFWFAFQNGFSSQAILAQLEEKAQLYALAEGPAPHLVLSEIVRALPTSDAAGPHARGYARLLDRFLAAVARHVDDLGDVLPTHRYLHQLHRLSEVEIRRLARGL